MAPTPVETLGFAAPLLLPLAKRIEALELREESLRQGELERYGSLLSQGDAPGHMSELLGVALSAGFAGLVFHFPSAPVAGITCDFMSSNAARIDDERFMPLLRSERCSNLHLHADSPLDRLDPRQSCARTVCGVGRGRYGVLHVPLALVAVLRKRGILYFCERVPLLRYRDLQRRVVQLVHQHCFPGGISVLPLLVFEFAFPVVLPSCAADPPAVAVEEPDGSYGDGDRDLAAISRQLFEMVTSLSGY